MGRESQQGCVNNSTETATIFTQKHMQFCTCIFSKEFYHDQFDRFYFIRKYIYIYNIKSANAYSVFLSDIIGVSSHTGSLLLFAH